MKRIVIFASGNGSNAENIARFFENRDSAQVVALFTNNENARAIERMKPFNIPTSVFTKQEWNDGTPIVELLSSLKADIIVLAGFLAFIKQPILDAYPHGIINIHPSLLPKFGGKGMWGDHVHEAVIQAGETQSGITIHYVTAHIDGGEIIAQFTCEVRHGDTAATLAQRIHDLEYAHFPETIEKICLNG